MQVCLTVCTIYCDHMNGYTFIHILRVICLTICCCLGCVFSNYSDLISDPWSYSQSTITEILFIDNHLTMVFVLMLLVFTSTYICRHHV